MSSVNYVIETEKLKKEFLKTKKISDLVLHPSSKNSVLALSDVDIKINKSEFVCLLGLNGAGKSTLLRILSGLLVPTSGKAYINGLELNANLQRIKRKVGFMSSDERSFYWRLSAWENLAFFGTLYGITKKQLNIRLKELFSLFEIDNPNRRFYEYSVGFKQRLCFIRALLHKPDILLLDEPLKNLDYIIREKLLKFVREKLIKQQQKTVVLSASSLDNIEIYDRLIILDKGKVRAQGSREELRKVLGVSDLDIEKISKILCG